MRIIFKVKLKGIYVSLMYCGDNIGRPCLVLDSFGCNRKCDYCTADNYYHPKDIYDTERFGIYYLDELLFIITELEYKFIVISGGEPTIQDFSELIKILKKSGYTVIMETNGKKYSKDLELCDTVIFNIKTFSAGKPYSKKDDMDWYKNELDDAVFTCTIKDMKDIDYLAANFYDYDLWIFLEFDELSFNEYLEKILKYDNWRMCFRMDRILNLDFESIHKRKEMMIKEELDARKASPESSIQDLLHQQKQVFNLNKGENVNG